MTAESSANAEPTPEASPTPDVPSPGLVGRALYSASYYVSFGITFPAVLLSTLVPADSAIAQGFYDGACSARDANDRLRAKAMAATQATCEKVGGAYSQVAAQVTERVESIQDALAERRYRRRLATA